MRNVLTLIFLCSFILTDLLTFSQAPLTFRDTSIKGPQTFAIIVGISKYKFVKPLQFADKDAELFREYLKSPAGGYVKDGNIYSLLNEKANNSNFWGKGFQWLKAKNLQRGDKLFIYLAGHGDAIDEDQFFFLGYDCNPAGDKNNYLVGGTIQLFNLKKKIAAETAKGVDVVFIMDACRSNELPGGAEGLNFLNTAISEKKAGEIIMLATGAGQEALEDATIGNGHGLFTYFLVDGLNGLADSKTNPDNRISFREIETYVNQQVPLVAQRLFKRNQDPYFCCSEKSEQIISRVDSAYLINWLKKRRALTGTPGNSVPEDGSLQEGLLANDTALINLYNKFNQAVQETSPRGRNEAANFYNELERKFPGTPYTLDARSSLAVAYLDFAQAKMDEYIACATNQSQTEIIEAGQRLEKAIELFRYDDIDFANSLLNRLYFLRSSVDHSAAAFQSAYAAKNIDPAGAYILNKLALLHLNNNNLDSAHFYASRAIQVAPKWACAFTTFSLVKPGMDSLSGKRPGSKKSAIGITVGGGANLPSMSFSRTNWRQGQVNYNDSLNNITTSSGSRFNFGIFFYLRLGKNITWRPEIQLSYENGQIVYDRRRPGTPENFLDAQSIQQMSLNALMPLLVEFGSKDVSPYISAGPGFYLHVQQPTNLTLQKYDLTGAGSLGLNIRLKNTNLVISPEVKYIHGFRNLKGQGDNLYMNTISEIQRKAFTFNLYLRKG